MDEPYIDYELLDQHRKERIAEEEKARAQEALETAGFDLEKKAVAEPSADRTYEEVIASMKAEGAFPAAPDTSPPPMAEAVAVFAVALLFVGVAGGGLAMLVRLIKRLATSGGEKKPGLLARFTVSSLTWLPPQLAWYLLVALFFFLFQPFGPVDQISNGQGIAFVALMFLPPAVVVFFWMRNKGVRSP